MGRVWKTLQLFVAFHRDQEQRERRFPYLWPPRGARASVTNRESDGREAFVLVKGDREHRDVQIKVWPDRLVLRRDEGLDWSGIVVTDHSVAVRVAERWVEVRSDGSVKSASEQEGGQEGGDVTILEADGAIYRWTDLAEIIVSSDGLNISRRSPEGISAITPRGVVVKHRE